MSNNKIIGIRTNPTIAKKLNEEIYKNNLTKEKWLDKNLKLSEGKSKLSFHDKEGWVTIPTAEYNSLLTFTYREHAAVIFNRIKEHIVQRGRLVTFDNMLEQIEIFADVNNFKNSKRIEDGDLIYDTEHNIGICYSNFLSVIIRMIAENTNTYDLVDETIRVNSNSFVLQKKFC